MTPKEKALELMGIFGNIFLEDEEEHYVGTVSRLSKQCALIAVDEILLETDDNYDSLHASDRRIYWQDVKQEIEKL